MSGHLASTCPKCGQKVEPKNVVYKDIYGDAFCPFCREFYYCAKSGEIKCRGCGKTIIIKE